MIIQLEMCHLEISQPQNDGTRDPEIHHSDQYTGLDRTAQFARSLKSATMPTGMSFFLSCSIVGSHEGVPGTGADVIVFSCIEDIRRSRGSSAECCKS